MRFGTYVSDDSARPGRQGRLHNSRPDPMCHQSLLVDREDRARTKGLREHPGCPDGRRRPEGPAHRRPSVSGAAWARMAGGRKEGAHQVSRKKSNKSNNVPYAILSP